MLPLRRYRIIVTLIVVSYATMISHYAISLFAYYHKAGFAYYATTAIYAASSHEPHTIGHALIFTLILMPHLLILRHRLLTPTLLMPLRYYAADADTPIFIIITFYAVTPPPLAADAATLLRGFEIHTPHYAGFSPARRFLCHDIAATLIRRYSHFAATYGATRQYASWLIYCRYYYCRFSLHNIAAITLPFSPHYADGYATYAKT